jgi:hypothetical protein
VAIVYFLFVGIIVIVNVMFTLLLDRALYCYTGANLNGEEVAR